MKILHVVYVPRHSGAEALVAAIGKKQDQLGHQVKVISLRKPEPNFLPVIDDQARHGIEWISPSKSEGPLTRLTSLARSRWIFKPDAIFAHSVIPAFYARIAFGNNVFSVLHSATEDDYSRRLFSLPEVFLQLKTAGVITVSKLAAHNYRKRFSSPPVKIIPNGIDVSRYSHPPSYNTLERLRRSLCFTDGSQFIVQIGRISEAKQQHLTISATATLLKKYPRLHLILAGTIEEPEYFTTLKTFVNQEKITEKVHFLGPRSDVSTLLWASDLFLMPSAREAHSVAMLEALASGIRIIASNLPSLSFFEGTPGVSLVAPTDLSIISTLSELAVNEPRRYDRNLACFDIAKTADAYIDLAKTVQSKRFL